MHQLILGQKIAEGGQNYIFLAKDITNGQPYVIKAAKSHVNGKYTKLLKKEYELMHKKLSDLDCIIRPLCLSKSLVDPYNYSQIVTYPEEFMIMEYAKYGSLHELL